MWTLLAIGGIALLIVIVIVGSVIAARSIAKRADREIDTFPRCEITGQPLTVRQQFEHECG